MTYLLLANLCGYGTAISGSCSCPIGYNSVTNCTTCLAGYLFLLFSFFTFSPLLLYYPAPCSCNILWLIRRYYGASCTACQCVSGTCDSGTTGTGQCTCNAGYVGSKCNTPLSPCSTVVSYIHVSSSFYFSSLFFDLSQSTSFVRQTTTTPGAVVNPTSGTVYMSGGTMQYPLSLNVPLKPTKLDVLLLIDISQGISVSSLLYLKINWAPNNEFIDFDQQRNLQGTYAQTFINNVQTLSNDVYFGLATFGGPTSCSQTLVFNVNLALTRKFTQFFIPLWFLISLI